MGGGEAQQRIITINTLDRQKDGWTDKQIQVMCWKMICALEKKIMERQIGSVGEGWNTLLYQWLEKTTQG